MNMNQAIIFTNTNILGLLLEINLKAYVDTHAYLCSNVSQLEQLLQDKKNIKFIVCCFDKLISSDGLHEKLSKLDLPIIIMGVKGGGKYTMIENRYDIKSLVQNAAQILSVTAKDMASIEVPKYFEVSINLLKKLGKAPCEIYSRNPVDRDDEKYNYFTVCEKSQELTLEKFEKNGLDNLFIDSFERLRFINKATSLIIDDLKRKDLTHQERISITSKGMIVVAEEVFENPIAINTISEISKTCISSIHQVIEDNHKLNSLLKNFLAVKNEYVFMRTVITTYIASGIIKNLSWGSVDQIEKVSFALFFHDIYLVDIFRKYPDQLNEQELLFTEDISDEDKDIILNHAKMASQLVAKISKAPMGSVDIIAQHHGMTSGEGFAVNFKDDISPLAKIMIIAEDITTNIIDQFYLQQKPKNKILDKELIQLRLLEKFKNHTYKKIIKAFEKVAL